MSKAAPRESAIDGRDYLTPVSGILAAMGRPPQTDVTGRPIAPRDVDLATFFRPRSVAVIGASATPRRPATAMWKKIQLWGERFGATVTPVNPRYTELDGVPCVASIADVPGPVDLAVILVGDAVAAFEEVVATGARFAVIFAAGFAEVGGDGDRPAGAPREAGAASPTRTCSVRTRTSTRSRRSATTCPASASR